MIDERNFMGRIKRFARGDCSNLGHGWLYYGIARLMRPEVIVEIGRYYGFSMLLFAQACKDNNKGHVWSIDREDRPLAGRLEKCGMQDLPVYYTVLTGLSMNLAGEVPDEIDLLFIDGDHSYEACLLDTEMYAARVRPGGFCLWHDTVLYPGCAQVVAELDRREWELLTFPVNPTTPENEGLTIGRRL